MGVLNVTPDSFSDGGRFLEHEAAVAQGEKLAREGAAIVDVGGESTRPGASEVGVEEERRRVVPVVRALAASGIAVSIDTSKLTVAEAALDAGASLVNDVTGLGRDPEIADLCAERGAGLVVVHMQGTPSTMQRAPRYDDVVAEVRSFLLERREQALSAGVDAGRLWLDPGIGFGKTVDHNLELLRDLGRLRALGCPLVVGTSRKRFISVLDGFAAEDRLGGSIASGLAAASGGADVLRVHDVAATRQALAVWSRIADRPLSPSGRSTPPAAAAVPAGERRRRPAAGRRER